jgi:PAS domain S-box-containing protein
LDERPGFLTDGLTLGDIMDVQAVQLVMNTFYSLTQSGNAILDLQGNVLVATGWQDICMKFHRRHPETCRHCHESDVQLASGVEPGTFKLYRCLNGLWDIVTPIAVEGKHVGNLYLGQFLFDDEAVDYDQFRAAARRYGFDEIEYIAALDRAPRMSRQTINSAMEFCVQFANLISVMGFNALKLEQKVAFQTQELTALNEEMTAQLEEIALFNRSLERLNDDLERRVAERTSELAGAHEELLAQYDELRQAQETEQRNAAVQAVLKEIAEAALMTPTLDSLYEAVHRSIRRVLPANQFHINILDEAAGEFVVPYNADPISLIPSRRPIGKGLSEYVMKLGRAVQITPADQKRLERNGEYGLAAVQKVKPRHYMGSPLIDSQGKPFGTISLIQMGTDNPFRVDDVRVLSIIAAQVSMAIIRKRAEEELRNTDDHLRKLIDYASAPIIVWDPSFTITRFNRAFEQLSGYSRQEVHGGPLSILFPPDQLDSVMALIEASRSGEYWESVEIPIRRKTGEVRITLWNSANIYAADAVTLTAVIAQGQDITERVRREQEAQQNERAARRVQEALLAAPEPSEYLDVTLMYKPLGFVGGDLYFLDWRNDGTLLRGFLVDTTGHGLATALHTASLQALLREVNDNDLPLGEAMRWINRRVAAYFAEGIYAGALGFELDLETRELRWVSAGLPEFWLANRLVTGVVQSPGLFLGVHDCETFDVHSLPLAEGDCVYFLTDGLSDLLQDRPDLPLSRFPQMLELLVQLSESVERRDDATAVCIRVRSLPWSQSRQSGWPRTLHFNGYGDYQRLKGEVSRILAENTGLEHSKQEVAVHEALANAMECRDGVSRQHRASVRFNKIGKYLVVRVKTSRLAFAGNAMLRRLRSQPEEMFAFGEDASMGRGIPMMMCLSDKMTYNGEGTELLLAWKL